MNQNNYNRDDVEKAMAIIYRACLNGKLLTKMKLWEHLDWEARVIAWKETEWIRKVAKARVSIEEWQEMAAVTQEEVL